MLLVSQLKDNREPELREGSRFVTTIMPKVALICYTYNIKTCDHNKFLISCSGGRRLLAEEVQVRYGVRVQLDVLRPDAGTGNAALRQVRAVRVVERRK